MSIALREAAGVLIGLMGVIGLTRLIGPASFGLYAAGVTVQGYLCTLGQWGLQVYLVRRPGDVPRGWFDQAFTLAAGLGVLVLLAGVALAPTIEAWTRIAGFSSVARVLFLGIPGTLLAQVPRAILERQLEFRGLARMELIGQIIFYLVALPVAVLGGGAWAPVAGWWLQTVVIWLQLYRKTSYRPRFTWNPSHVREMLYDGLSYSGANWIWQARTLVNPLLVGRIVGVAGVGYVDLAIRFVDNLSFVRVAASRVSIAALARVQEDRDRLRRALADGARLQILALGVLLVGFAWIAPWVVPMIFGSQWLPVLVVYPFVALGSVTNSLFNMETSVLYVLRRNVDVLTFNVAYLAVYATTALILLQAAGLIGYGLAEAAALATYGILHGLVARRIGKPELTIAVPWWAAFACALFVHLFGWWLVVPLIAVAAWPRTWAEIRALALPLLPRRVD